MGKKQRRSAGEGTVYKAPNGTWIAQATVGRDPKTGKPKRRSFYGKTRKEAIEKLNKVLNDVQTGNYIEPTNVTLGQWIKDWLNGRKQHIAESTWNTYETMERCHITPTLGAVKLKDLRTRDIQNLLNEKLASGRLDGTKKCSGCGESFSKHTALTACDKCGAPLKGGLSPRTVKYIYQTLHSALQQAVKERLIAHNVAEAVELPKTDSKEMRTFTVEELGKFFSVAKESPFFTAYLVALSTGLRRGELLGLRWRDIDMDNRKISVRQQVVKGRKKVMITEPKTQKSKRTFTVHSDIIKALKTHRAPQSQRKLLMQPYNEKENPTGYKDHDLVFCKDDGTPLEPRTFVGHFESLVKKAGLPKIRFHDCRHTFATLSLESGISLKAIQEFLGHSTISVTGDTYSHVTQKMQEEVANNIGSVLAGCIKK